MNAFTPGKKAAATGGFFADKMLIIQRIARRVP